MGNNGSQEESTLVAYGYSKDQCLDSLQALIQYEHDAKLYSDRPQTDVIELGGVKTKTEANYYVVANGQPHYVKFMRRTSDGPWKAVIYL
jgi:hypothetical protein